MKHRLPVLTALLVLFVLVPARSHVVALSDSWYFITGAKGYYSSGAARENFYYKPYAEAFIPFLIMEITPGVYRYQGYQLTDGMGRYKNIDFTQGGIELLIAPAPWIDLSAGYRYARGETGFRGNEASADLAFYLGMSDLSFSGSYRETSYDFDGAVIDTEDLSLAGELNFNIERRGSVYGAIEYTALKYSTVPSDYSTVRGRLGFSLFLWEGSILMASCSYGEDSADYSSIGAEAVIKIRLGDRLSAFAMYQHFYFIAPVVSGTDTGTHGPGSGPARGGSNPFLQSSLLGEDYHSRSAGFGISLKL